MKLLHSDTPRRCPKCGIEKTIGDFHKNAAHASGVSSECGVCAGIRVKIWREKNKDLVIKKQREHYHLNRDKLRERARIWHHSNKDRARETAKRQRDRNKDRIKAQKRLETTGFTEEMFATAIAMQNGKCAICGVELSTLPKRQVHADHCHTTGEARGILCHHCNVALGYLRDSAELLQRAISYLENPPMGIA